jgi:hypothetical protein
MTLGWRPCAVRCLSLSALLPPLLPATWLRAAPIEALPAASCIPRPLASHRPASAINLSGCACMSKTGVEGPPHVNAKPAGTLCFRSRGGLLTARLLCAWRPSAEDKAKNGRRAGARGIGVAGAQPQGAPGNAAQARRRQQQAGRGGRESGIARRWRPGVAVAGAAAVYVPSGLIFYLAFLIRGADSRRHSIPSAAARFEDPRPPPDHQAHPRRACCLPCLVLELHCCGGSAPAAANALSPHSGALSPPAAGASDAGGGVGGGCAAAGPLPLPPPAGPGRSAAGLRGGSRRPRARRRRHGRRCRAAQTRRRRGHHHGRPRALRATARQGRGQSRRSHAGRRRRRRRCPWGCPWGHPACLASGRRARLPQSQGPRGRRGHGRKARSQGAPA